MQAEHLRTITLAVLAWLLTAAGAIAACESGAAVTILVYHRFGPTVADSMTVTTAVFEQQLAWLAANQYHPVPLRTLVDGLRGTEPLPSPHSIVITIDDGHRSVYTEAFPLIRKYRLPVTLFIYPSAISNASYALTWDQIAEMAHSGLVDIQSHTVWHPNFRIERARRNAAEYSAFVRLQLDRSKALLEKRIGKPVDMLAWPFGIYDPWLEQAAREAGYVAALSIDRGPTCADADLLALPRYLMTDRDRGPRFAAIAQGLAR